jgi:hypothetical protein
MLHLVEKGDGSTQPNNTTLAPLLKRSTINLLNLPNILPKLINKLNRRRLFLKHSMDNILRPLSQDTLNLNLDINMARNTNNQVQTCNHKDIKDSQESVASQINFKTCTCHRLA